jgi:peptide subunit release factor 1 (eRF1)
VLDDLLGRTELKDRIDDLEEANHHLERQLEAEGERRRDAASARQDAEERVNRLEDRIAGLEGRLDRAATNGGTDRTFRRREAAHGPRLDSILSRLEHVETGPEGALSAYVEAGALPDALADLLGDRASLLSRATPCLVYADDAGLVAAALDPPVAPDPFCAWDDGFRVERRWLQPTGAHAVALVRSDLFAVGTFEGTERTALRGFTSDVKSKHSKGGFSQGRFERIRDGQIHDHLTACHEVLDGLDADRLFVVGERTVLDEFEARADATATVDATGAPEAALEHAVRDFWTVRVLGL